MTLQTGSSVSGGTGIDYLIGVGGPNSTQSGNGGNDLLVGDYGSFSALTSTTVTSATSAINIDASFAWYTGVNNPLVTDNSVPNISLHLTGGDNDVFLGVTVGANEAITVDIDFSTFDSIVEVGHLVGGNLIVLASNNDDSSDFVVDDPARNLFTESYLSYENTSGFTDLVIRLSQLGGANGGDIALNEQTLLNVSVTGHAATGNPANFADGNDVQFGGDGDDHIYGLGSDDTLFGGANDDRLDGGAGADTMEGGTGNDDYYVDNINDIVTEVAGEGTERVHSSITYTLDSNLENLTLIGSDTISGTGNGLDNSIIGNAEANTLNGGDGADTLNGGDGDDFIFGGATSADLRDVVFAGSGNDSVDGGFGNDLIFGQDGNDTIAGGFGSDTLNGQDGNDVITGSALSDLVSGNAGDDFVNGGFGHDRINGGSGADRFFHLGIRDHGSDFIQDYTAAEGDVLLSGIAGVTHDQFQVNFNDAVAPSGEAAGDDNVQEAFVIYRPTGQILWALIDGAGQSEINLRIGTDTFDLLA